MKRLIFLGVVIAAISFSQNKSFAMVDMQNANFTESWVDLEVPNTGYNLKIERAYNSRTLYNGIFGFAWCSNFETSLEVLADGRIKRKECGAGQENVYSPRGFDTKEVKESIQKIIAAMKKDNPRMTSREIQALTEKLKFDTGYRDHEAERLGIHKEVREGTIYYSDTNNTDKIIFKKDYYVHELSDGSSERFNRQGQLAYLYDKNENYLKLDYNKNLLMSVTTGSGYKLSFTYTQNGKVKEIHGPNNLNCEYKYEKMVDLVYAKNAKNDIHQYEYDQLHDMVKIVYPDKTVKTLKYNQDKDWVTELRDRSGCVEKYDYVLSKDDPKNHYTSEVEKTCEGKVVNKSSYSFWFKPRANASGIFLSKLVMDINGQKTEITYHDVFEKPISVKKDKELILYTYYPNGLLKTKKTGNDLVIFSYNSINKISEVHEGKKVTKFTYDKVGNLISAANSSGQSVRMEYDSHGRIVKLIDQARRLINITYDERFGKPKVIDRPGVGKIFVTYNSEGQVLKAEPKDNNPAVAVQVASAFNNLLDIITPSGVSIGL